MEDSYTLYRDKKPFVIKSNQLDTIESNSSKISDLYDIGNKNTNDINDCKLRIDQLYDIGDKNTKDINECKLYIKKLNRYKWLSGLKTKRRRRY
jgi:peptidoglycan hydrolase CwlO-like protein